MIVKLITNQAYDDQLTKIDQTFFSEILNGYHLSREAIKKFVSDAEVLMLASESVIPFDKELISSCKKTKYISIDTTDFSWIDVEYAKSKGIIVSNSPHASTEAVAEHTIAMMLNFAKQIHFAYQDLYLHHAEMKNRLGFELRGKTLGIIGLGSIGLRLAEIASGFGMKVLAWNRSAKQSGLVKIVSLDTLLAESDFVSLQVANNIETANFLDQEKINQMKLSAYIINLCDKSMVNTEAVYQALLSKRLSGYGVELWDIKEAKEHPLYQLDNVIAFPGFGWYTQESLARTFKIFLANIQSYLQGDIVNRVN